MKQCPDVKPFLHGENVMSLNLMRLRGRTRKIAPGYLSPPRFTKQERMRRVAIRARTGGYCRG